MLKNIPAFALAAMTVIATTSGAFAGATAAETSHDVVSSSWNELQRAEDTGRAWKPAPANWATQSATSLSSNPTGIKAATEAPSFADQTARPVYKSIPTASTSVSIF